MAWTIHEGGAWIIHGNLALNYYAEGVWMGPGGRGWISHGGIVWMVPDEVCIMWIVYGGEAGR